MYANNNLSLKEVSAEIRNKLQSAKTALELIRSGKEVSKEYINRALGDLEKIVEVIL